MTRKALAAVDFDLTDAKRTPGRRAGHILQPSRRMGPTRQNDKYRLSPSLNYVAAFDYFRPEERDMKVSDFELFIPVGSCISATDTNTASTHNCRSIPTPARRGEFLAESDFRPSLSTSPTQITPRLSPDFSQVITVAEVDKAKKEGRQVGVTTRKESQAG